MEEKEEDFIVDPLFLAVTRPAMMMGVPIEAMVLILGTFSVTLTSLGNPIYAGAVGLVMYGIARLVTRHDVNAFRLLFLWGRTKMANRNRRLWGGSSYSPLPLDALRRKGFGRYVD
ncbi:MAG: VirB3 family type IV secretion system protein [Pseudomonadota bacterium]